MKKTICALVVVLVANAGIACGRKTAPRGAADDGGMVEGEEELAGIIAPQKGEEGRAGSKKPPSTPSSTPSSSSSAAPPR